MASILWGVSPFDEAVEKATSELLPSGSDDMALNLEICDMIRAKTVTSNAAMKSLKARVNHKNPNVQLLALTLVDVCIKNGGDSFLAQITGREFIDNLVSILKQPALNIDVKTALLRYIQIWALSTQGKATAAHLQSVYGQLLKEGFKFPPKDPTLANSAMTETLVAPDWVDSDVCFRCRSAFTFTNRKHHCRNCGQVFDQQCSSKSRPLPHFGITQDVRVCDGCYHALENRRIPRHSAGESSSHAPHTGRQRSISGFADADLQRALALSLQENRQYNENNHRISEPPIVDRRTQTFADDDDEDLRRAIAESLREAEGPRPSAPPSMPEQYQPTYYSEQVPQRPAFSLPNYDLDPQEGDAVLTFSQTVEEAQAQGGLAGRNGPALNGLYDRANHVRPKLAMNLDDTDRKQQMLFDMSNKIAEAAKLYEFHLTQQERALTWKRTSYLPPQSTPLPQQPQVSYEQQQATYHPTPAQPIMNPPEPSSPRQEYPVQQHTYSYDSRPAPVSIPSSEWRPVAPPISVPLPVSPNPTGSVSEPPTEAFAQVHISQQVDPAARVNVVPPMAVSPPVAAPPAQYTPTASIAPHAAGNSTAVHPHARAYAPPNQYMFPTAPATSPFPSVPSSEPQYVNFPPPVQEERKEALLIEL